MWERALPREASWLSACFESASPEGLVENVGRGLHRIDRTAAAHAENHVGALHLFVRGDALNVGHRGVLAVDEPVDDFNAGLFETRTQLRTRLF